MAVNGYSVGRDVTLDIVDATGALVRPSIATGFSSKQITTDRDVQRLDGQNDGLYLPKGWSGDFDYERQNSVLEDYIVSIEASYYAGANLSPLTITETIRENNGAVTQYRYTGVQIKLDDSGAWKGDDTVKQKLAWTATRRQKIS